MRSEATDALELVEEVEETRLELVEGRCGVLRREATPVARARAHRPLGECTVGRTSIYVATSAVECSNHRRQYPCRL